MPFECSLLGPEPSAIGRVLHTEKLLLQPPTQIVLHAKEAWKRSLFSLADMTS